MYKNDSKHTAELKLPAITSLRADTLNLVYISALYVIRGPAAPQASYYCQIRCIAQYVLHTLKGVWVVLFRE